MDYSYFLGAFLGLYLIIVGIALLTRKEMFQELIKDFIKNPPIIFFSGILSLLFGLFIVLTHNAWFMSWVVLITILGYLYVIQGIIQIYLPEWIEEKVQKYFQGNTLYYIGALLTLLGLFLAYRGFWG